MNPAQAPTDPGSADLPLAETLDEATLRQVFPEAPASLAVPRDVRSMWRRRMKRLGGERRTIGLALWIGTLALGAILALGGSGTLGAVVGGAALLAAGGVAGWQYMRASDEFWGLYATARGLAEQEHGQMAANVPLFQKGDKRKWPRVLSGTIAGQPAQLGLYTYTEVSTDSDGDRDETDYDFTVLRFRLPPAVARRFAGIYCSPKGLSLGALQDKLAHDRAVKLESIEFHKRYSLRCVDEQDEVALYELFSTPFVHRLATELKVFWEQRGEDLLVWKKGHETEAADLDRFCLEAWHVLHRYHEEHM